MNIEIRPVPAKNGQKIWYTLEWGKKPGERKATGIFTYSKPRSQLEKNHNKEALAVLENKKAQLIIEQQAAGSNYIPIHKFKSNFLDYYSEYVENNKRNGNRHLECSFTQFGKFIAKDFLPIIEVNENLCTRFLQYLLDHFNGECPANYFAKFKKVIRAATKDGYFKSNPVEDVKAILEKEASTGLVFSLPSHTGALKVLRQWCKDAAIDKHITWHSARLSFSILLQDEKVDTATVALLLGHTSTKYVDEVYKRHRPKDQSEAIRKLPQSYKYIPISLRDFNMN